MVSISVFSTEKSMMPSTTVRGISRSGGEVPLAEEQTLIKGVKDNG
jgi:hypothetical protein